MSAKSLSSSGYHENPRPEYDVYYFLDLSPEVAGAYFNELNKVFTDGAAHDAVIVGHGDYKIDPATNDPTTDRINQLTPVTL